MSAYLKTQGLSEISILLNSALITLFVFHRFPTTHTKELASIFLAFLKIGSLLFGSGYVLMSFLQTEFIDKRGWISSQQLLDAITVGQFTPGPVFTTASFIGFLLDGIPGAFVATVGIFLPAFVFVALSLFLYERLSKSILFRSLLDGVVAGSLGLLLTTLWILCSLTFQNTSALVLFILALFLVHNTRIPTALLILAGGLCSLLLVKI
jgi:Chromate transport protein ChrA